VRRASKRSGRAEIELVGLRGPAQSRDRRSILPALDLDLVVPHAIRLQQQFSATDSHRSMCLDANELHVQMGAAYHPDSLPTPLRAARAPDRCSQQGASLAQQQFSATTPERHLCAAGRPVGAVQIRGLLPSVYAHLHHLASAAHH